MSQILNTTDPSQSDITAPSQSDITALNFKSSTELQKLFSLKLEYKGLCYLYIMESKVYISALKTILEVNLQDRKVEVVDQGGDENIEPQYGKLISIGSKIIVADSTSSLKIINLKTKSLEAKILTETVIENIVFNGKYLLTFGDGTIMKWRLPSAELLNANNLVLEQKVHISRLSKYACNDKYIFFTIRDATIQFIPIENLNSSPVILCKLDYITNLKHFNPRSLTCNNKNIALVFWGDDAFVDENDINKDYLLIVDIAQKTKKYSRITYPGGDNIKFVDEILVYRDGSRVNIIQNNNVYHINLPGDYSSIALNRKYLVALYKPSLEFNTELHVYSMVN